MALKSVTFLFVFGFCLLQYILLGNTGNLLTTNTNNYKNNSEIDRKNYLKQLDNEFNNVQATNRRHRIIAKRDASTETDSEENVTFVDVQDGQNITYTKEQILEEIRSYIYPTVWMWVLICFHCIVFVMGLVGNILVCIAVYRNHTMRTVTNYFIVNLAVADFLVILFCLPPSVVWDVTSTWFFGVAMCKVVLYLQVSPFACILWVQLRFISYFC